VLKGWGGKWPSCRRYYASLQFARPEAFLANAKEMYEKNQALPGRPECITGRTYTALKIPKVFCRGSGKGSQVPGSRFKVGDKDRMDDPKTCRSRLSSLKK